MQIISSRFPCGVPRMPWRVGPGKAVKESARWATVYSDAPVVELLVNGQSLGKKKTKQDMAKFKKVTYQEGQIEAVAYDASGKETGRSKLVSASGKTKISLRPECQSLRANGQDLCFLNIDLVGENGITKSSV